MALSSGAVTREIIRRFKLNGLSIKTDAVKALQRVLAHEDEMDTPLTAIISSIKDRIERQELQSSVVDAGTIANVVADLTNEDSDLQSESIVILNAFNGPALTFDPNRKTLYYEGESARKRTMHAEPESKPRMFRERFLLAQQRVLQNESFCPPVITSSRKDYLKLTQLDFLLGTSSRKVVLGMLTQPVEGRYYLEDLMTQVPLDLSEVQATKGLFTEGCIVILEGEMVDGVFKAALMAFPPAERRVTTLKAIGVVDTFGTGILPQHMQRMELLGREATGSMLILVSDVHLDSPIVMDRLRTLLSGFSKISPPPVFVFFGNFLSTPVTRTAGAVDQAKAHFDELASLIAEFPTLAARREDGTCARFILIPGPQDPGAGSTLPRPPLPNFFTKDLQERVEGLHLGTNPCRLRWYSKVIVLFREDIVKRMQRHCVIPPVSPPAAPHNDDGDDEDDDEEEEDDSDEEEEEEGGGGEGEGDEMEVDGDSDAENVEGKEKGKKKEGGKGKGKGKAMASSQGRSDEGDGDTAAAAAGGGGGEEVVDVTEHLVKTVLDQGHLCPLPFSSRPIYWEYDAALRLYPLPHVTVLADRTDHYTRWHTDSVVLNPGSFPLDGGFMVCFPADDRAEYSRISTTA